MSALLERNLLRLIQEANWRLSALSVRLTRWSRKSSVPIHPKHLAEVDGHNWYLPYVSGRGTVLDLGCGNGYHSLKVAEGAARFVGLDLSSRQLEAALAAARKKGVGQALFVRANLDAPFPLRTSTFDVVMALDVIEHLMNRSAFLEEIRRVLKADGTLLISAPNRNTSWKRALRRHGLFWYSDPDHKTEYSQNELLDKLRREGFEPRTCMPVAYDTPLAGLVDLSGGVSLRLYASLARWKRRKAAESPGESTGFRVVCGKASG